MRRKGFTLAEVLITLGIIGVVAALTIPTLINNYQKQEYVVGLKIAYTEFNQALAQFANDNGCPGDLKCTGFFEAGSTSDDFANEIGKYFKGAKMDPFQYPWEISLDYDKMAAGSTSYIGNPKFITSSGISYSFPNSGYHDCSNLGPNNMAQLCDEKLTIDVNGPKLPNVGGRDIFYFFITNGKGPLLYPYGGADSPLPQWRWRDASKNPQGCYSGNTDATTCAGRIMDEGWQMNY